MNHIHNPPFLRVHQHTGRAWPFSIEESPFETSGLISTAHIPNRLRSQRDRLGNLWRTRAPGQLHQRQGTKDSSYLLNAAAQHLL